MLKISLLLLLILLPIALPVQAERYYPPCGDYQPPTMAGSFCRPAFMNGQLLRLRDGIPFAWIRSATGILMTIYPSQRATLQIEGSSVWDGYQWWWQVAPYPKSDGIVGWVEQASLIDSTSTEIDDPSVLINWTTPLNGQVEPGLPFLWLRDTPASTGGIIGTIPANGPIRILGTPAYDGVQWWWFVQYRSYTGYVEQSLIIAR